MTCPVMSLSSRRGHGVILFIRIIVILILFIITLGVTLDGSWQNWVLTLSSVRSNSILIRRH
ncbi:MAG: hypothetical protein CMJ52_08180 [Planctomycetaceae bacterium]|nr:hypothetical protein [Planctomycetaceae bacterium]